MKPVQTIVSRTVKASSEKAFHYIVPIKLSHIFKRYKILPAVIRTDESEKWIKPGLVRTVYFEDGTRAQETLLSVLPNQSFSYKIENFTSPLRWFAERVEGDWSFEALDDSKTRIEWRYQIIPKNKFARLIVKTFLIKQVHGLLNNAMSILQNDLET